MNALALASATVKISADTRLFKAGLDGVRNQLLGFVPVAQMIGGRIGGSLIGAFGHAIVARRAEKMMTGPQGAVNRSQQGVHIARGDLDASKKILADAKDKMRDIQDKIRDQRAQLATVHPTFHGQIKGQIQQLNQQLGLARITVRAAQQQVGQSQAALTAANQTAQAAKTAFAGAAAGIGQMAMATTGAISLLGSLAVAMTNLARAGSNLSRAEHNVDQVFGRSASTIESAADRQHKAFGQSKSDYLAYATDVGRHLQMLGVNEETATVITTRLLDAVQKLAQSRGISFGEAFQQTNARGSLFTDAQLRAYAFEKQLIMNRNQHLNAGVEAALRYQMATERISATTEDAGVSTATWQGQLNKLQGNLETIAQTVGQGLDPTFVHFFQTINSWFDKLNENGFWDLYKHYLGENLKTALGAVGVEIPEPNNIQAPGDVSERNAKATKKAAQQEAFGEMVQHGGAHGGSGFQGGVADLWKHIQNAAWNQNQIKIQQKQLDKLNQMAADIKHMANKPDAKKNPVAAALAQPMF